MIDRRAVLLSAGCLMAPRSSRAAVEPWVSRLLDAALAQIGVTTIYDGAYLRLAYPGGDPPRERGVCTDVVIRAYRDGFGLDLQRLVHEDMARAFGDYPRLWGLRRPDASIDHRRVPNLARFLTRHRAALPIPRESADYQAGDLITQLLPGNLPHIAIVTGSPGASGYPLVIHNIGGGTRREDRLGAFPVTGRFRLVPTDG